MLRAVESVGSGLVDRHRHGAGSRVGLLAGMQLPGVESELSGFLFVSHHHFSFFSLRMRYHGSSYKKSSAAQPTGGGLGQIGYLVQVVGRILVNVVVDPIGKQ